MTYHNFCGKSQNFGAELIDGDATYVTAIVRDGLIVTQTKNIPIGDIGNPISSAGDSVHKLTVDRQNIILRQQLITRQADDPLQKQRCVAFVRMKCDHITTIRYLSSVKLAHQNHVAIAVYWGHAVVPDNNDLDPENGED